MKKKVIVRYRELLFIIIFSYFSKKLNKMKIQFFVLVYFGFVCSINEIPYNDDSPWNSCNKQEKPLQSPININYFSPIDIKFPSFPSFVLNNTFYSPINNKKFKLIPQSNCDKPNTYNDLIMDLTGFGQAYVLYLNKTVKYNLKELRLRVYSEHTFEGGKMDLELQIIHDLDPSSQNILSDKYGKQLGIAVLFSTSRDKKNKLLEQLIKEDTDQTDETKRYTFNNVTSFDLNQFTNFHEPYYFYIGSGTTPYDCCEKINWIVMKKVEYMSQEQLRQIQLAMMQLETSLINGNARKTQGGTTPNSIEYIEYIANEERDEEE